MHRLTYANVMATIAVFIALGGSSYAALTITTKNVRNNSLTSADVRNGSLTGRDVKDRSLRPRDFAGALPAGPQGPAGRDGATGPQGPDGLKGDQGDPAIGTTAFSDAELVTTLTSFVEPIVETTVTVTRRSRLHAIGHYTVRNESTTGTDEGQMRCLLRLEDAAGDSAGFGSLSRHNVPADVNGVTHVFATGGQAGATEVEPGSYKVQQACELLNDSASLGVEFADLTVIATPL